MSNGASRSPSFDLAPAAPRIICHSSFAWWSKPTAADCAANDTSRVLQPAVSTTSGPAQTARVPPSTNTHTQPQLAQRQPTTRTRNDTHSHNHTQPPPRTATATGSHTHGHSHSHSHSHSHTQTHTDTHSARAEHPVRSPTLTLVRRWF